MRWNAGILCAIYKQSLRDDTIRSSRSYKGGISPYDAIKSTANIQLSRRCEPTMILKIESSDLKKAKLNFL